MAKLLVWGFSELLPEKQWIENSIRDIIRKNYELFWYVNIETPAIESNQVLTSKWWEEVSKQIYGLYGLKQWGDDLKDFSLHFDLTVPLARYVVDHESEIKFPFKRYQMQKVWRGERQQKGRYKEFTQCDIDIIGDKLSISYDVEIVTVLFSALKEIFDFLLIDAPIEIHINNRKFIDGICQYYSIVWQNRIDFYALLDNYYKLSEIDFLIGKNDKEGNKTRKWLVDIVWEKYEEIYTILKTDIETLNFEWDVRNEWLFEWKQIYQSLKSKWVNVIFDPFITRGLDYYTGMVFETFITWYSNFWSICSGGRFDNLVGSIRKVANSKGSNLGGVGWSIWLSRLFCLLDDSGFLWNKKIPLAQVIIFHVPWWSLEYKEKIGSILRKQWIKTDIYYTEARMVHQIHYAESKNIPYWIFAWWDEEAKNIVLVKNLETRKNEEVSLEELAKFFG